MADWSVVGRARLSGGYRSRVERLRRACEAAEPLDLKLELDEVDRLDRPIHFLAVTDDEVIGYGAVTAGDEAEVCGMVHPAWRRRGVATALLGEVRQGARRLERESILIICEDAGPTALVWMRRLGAALESAERRMTVRLDGHSRLRIADDSGTDTRMTVRPATGDDRDALIRLLSEGFGRADPVDDRRAGTPVEQRLVGLDGDAVVGTLRLTESSRRTMIYGFVIDNERRGQRLGTRMLAAVVEQLRDQGVGEVGLEVDPNNTPAIRLYEGHGFETVTTYRYLRLTTAPAAR
jgi:ribosomal protein S18 acetylase RimI-like enzyme